MDDNGHESAGQEFARWLKPGGCIVLLLIFIAVLAVCLVSGKNPIPGYKPPQTSEYYSQHLDELQTELEENVFPVIGGVNESHVQDGKLYVTLEGSTFAVTRSAILRYYDENLFVFVDSADK
jgi:hypothetical protein